MRQSLSLLSLLLLASSAYAFDIEGHRGARWARPENTLPAFEYAINAGVDTLELDMYVTKDGYVVVSHDPTLNPDFCDDSLGRPVRKGISIRSLTLKELKTYDCGARVNPNFPTQQAVPGTRIPLLDEVFDLVKNSTAPKAKTVRLNIETKSEEAHPEWTPEPREFVERVFAVVKKHGMMDRIILQSFDYRTLKIGRELEPKLPLSVLIEDKPHDPKDLVKLVQTYDAQILSPSFEWLTTQEIKDLHQIGVQIIPWTVDKKSDWKKLIEMGVDGIITDNPKALIDYVRHP